MQRIRPKIMTVSAILFGLLPIMWSPATQSGADVKAEMHHFKRIAFTADNLRDGETIT